MRGGKLDIVVSIDVDCNNTRIKVRGNVDGRNIRTLYAVARRAVVLTPDPAIVLDLSEATATAEALEDLQACAATQTLPSRDGQYMHTCHLTVAAPARTTAGDMALAA